MFLQWNLFYYVMLMELTMLLITRCAVCPRHTLHWLLLQVEISSFLFNHFIHATEVLLFIIGMWFYFFFQKMSECRFINKYPRPNLKAEAVSVTCGSALSLYALYMYVSRVGVRVPGRLWSGLDVSSHVLLIPSQYNMRPSDTPM